ncbi:MAG TPA: type II secretion system protein GspG [Nitrospirae bacterium]|nr:type II secretion system protein GspG [Nitrospirota bacterium]
MRYTKRESGFTLIELMVVLVILGILATFLMPKILNRPNEARIIKATNDIRAIESALQLYKIDNGSYPTTEQGLIALVKKPDVEPIPRHYRNGGYLDSESTPLDPWGNEYIYRSPGEGDREYEIISFGADGKEGGEGVDADIRSWEIK